MPVLLPTAGVYPDVGRGAVELRGDAAGDVEQLHVVAQRRVAMRDADVQVYDVLAVEIGSLRIGVTRSRYEAVVGRLAARAVENIVDVVMRRDVERIEVKRIAHAAEVIAVAEGLIRPRQADVVREHAVGRSSAGLDRRLVVEGRPADRQIGIGIARIGSGLDHLIDVAGQTRRVRSRRRAAGIDLHFLIAQRGERGDRREIRLTRRRQTVELVGDLIDVAAANVDALIPALLIRRNGNARRAGDSTVRLTERARTGERRGRLLPGGVDREDVAGNARMHERLRRARRRARDGAQRGLHGDGSSCRLIG